MMIRDVDVVIIGGGPAGLAAALACRENGIEDVLILERDNYLGGILNQCIHNGFGLHLFGEELTGPEYAQRFIDKVEKERIPYLLNTMVLNVTKDRIVYAISPKEGIVKLKAKAVILAMGCRERTSGALMIPGTRPAGVYTAGMAQRLVNLEGYMPGREIVILGSGDIGLIMARRLVWEGANVNMVCELMPYSTGLQRNIRQCLDDYEIPLKFNHTVVQIHGKERVEGVTIAKVDKDRHPIPGSEEYVACDTLLLSVGLIPENELSQSAGVMLDRITGGPIVDEYRHTNIPGIFACGNVLQVHDVVDYVSQEAEIAGKGAALYIKNKFTEGGVCVKARAGVRYTVPQIIRYKESFEIFFRVDDIYKNGSIVLNYGGKVIYSRKYVQVTPGKMEKLRLPSNVLDKMHEGGSMEIRWVNAEEVAENDEACVHSVSQGM